LIGVGRIESVCLFGVGRLPFRDLNQFVSAVHPAIVRPLRARITPGFVTVEQPCHSDASAAIVTAATAVTASAATIPITTPRCMTRG
jgi:hypothetical protein